MSCRWISAIEVVSGISFGHDLHAVLGVAAVLDAAVGPSARPAARRRASCPVGCTLKRRAWLIGAGADEVGLVVVLGHASRQQPQVMQVRQHVASTAWSARATDAGPGPRSWVPSMGIHAFTCLRASNIRCGPPMRSRTSGNFFIGSRVIGCSSSSTSAEQACRALPLMIIVQVPQTSSRQLESQTTGVVACPPRSPGCAGSPSGRR